MTTCVDWLEKDRQYELAALVLSEMIKDRKNCKDSQKRGQWWHRLCVDLKHLKLKKECLKLAQHALLNEPGSVKIGIKNSLLKIHELLNKPTVSKKLTKKKKSKEEELEESILITLNQNQELLNQMVIEMNSQLNKCDLIGT